MKCCNRSFRNLFIARGGICYPCCPGWFTEEGLKLFEPTIYMDSLRDVWHSKEFNTFRESVWNGEYKYCSGICEVLQDLQNGRDNLECPDKIFVDKDARTVKTVRFEYDNGCNLKCITCRDKFLATNGELIQKELNRFKEIAKDVESIEMSGAGEALSSKHYREWMYNFNPKDYPRLKLISLMTNGQLMTKEFWEKATAIKPYIKEIRLSIDAACKETYEKIRLGGKWETLIENTKYTLANISTVEEIAFQFVVSKYNYKEILDFYDLMESLVKETGFKGKWTVTYIQYQHWPGSRKDLDLDIFTDPQVLESVRKDLNKLHRLNNILIMGCLTDENKDVYRYGDTFGYSKKE